MTDNGEDDVNNAISGSHNDDSLGINTDKMTDNGKDDVNNIISASYNDDILGINADKMLTMVKMKPMKILTIFQYLYQ
jgi:hypothetical protein